MEFPANMTRFSSSEATAEKLSFSTVPQREQVRDRTPSEPQSASFVTFQSPNVWLHPDEPVSGDGASVVGVSVAGAPVEGVLLPDVAGVPLTSPVLSSAPADVPSSRVPPCSVPSVFSASPPSGLFAHATRRAAAHNNAAVSTIP